MVDRAGVRAPPPQRHVEGVTDKFAAEVIGDGPADDTATERVDDDGQVQDAVPAPLLGHIGDPEAVWRVDPEPTLHEVVANVSFGIANGHTFPAASVYAPCRTAWRMSRSTRCGHTTFGRVLGPHS